jgi:hypothetical protein
MKNTFVLLVLVVSGLASAFAQADTLQIGSVNLNKRFLKAEFRVDEARGAAWMEISLDERVPGPRYCSVPGPVSRYPYPGPDHGYGRTDVRLCQPTYLVSQSEAMVPGLMYDAPAAQILFVNSRGQKIVCASVSQAYARITHRPYLAINTTGACRAYPRSDMTGTGIYFEAN